MRWAVKCFSFLCSMLNASGMRLIFMARSQSINRHVCKWLNVQGWWEEGMAQSLEAANTLVWGGEVQNHRRGQAPQLGTGKRSGAVAAASSPPGGAAAGGSHHFSSHRDAWGCSRCHLQLQQGLLPHPPCNPGRSHQDNWLISCHRDCWRVRALPVLAGTQPGKLSS